MVVVKVTNTEIAKSFAADPKLKDVMEKAGVVSKPSFELFKVIRYNPASKEKQWVIVTHKVKDFDAWVKVFDQEGPAQRASEGMVDVALARDINDPNNVHIVFDITDMAKAKAAIFSESKKAIDDERWCGRKTKNNDTTFTIKGPYMVNIPAGMPHAFKNLGKKTANLVVIFPTNIWKYDVLDYFPFKSDTVKLGSRFKKFKNSLAKK